MPAKNMGRPNEERKVRELLKKLQSLKAGKNRPVASDSTKRQAERATLRFVKQCNWRD